MNKDNLKKVAKTIQSLAKADILHEAYFEAFLKCLEEMISQKDPALSEKSMDIIEASLTLLHASDFNFGIKVSRQEVIRF